MIFMNPADIEKLGLKAGQVVNLTSHFDDGERHAFRFIVVPYPIPNMIVLPRIFRRQTRSCRLAASRKK
mgnify:CR=1 FL=1